MPVGRDPRRLDAVAGRIERASGRPVEPLRADFAALAEVRRLAEELLDRYDRIDVLVNNAGTYAHRRELTEDGHERTLAVNHLAPFLLTNLLLDRLRASAPARVVVTSSDAHRGGVLDFDDLELERGWSGLRAYSNSKLANVLFTRALARRLEHQGLVANCFHPGVVGTRLVRGGLVSIAWFGGPPARAPSPVRGGHAGLPGALARGRGDDGPVPRRPAPIDAARPGGGRPCGRAAVGDE